MSEHKTKKLQRWLIIRNGEDCRIVTKKPKLDANEVAIEINLEVPQPPRIVANVDITMPDPLPTTVNTKIVDFEL